MEHPADSQRLHLLAYGGVQGVGFRAFVRKTARRLGLYGYVRNRADGAVEVEAAGDATALQQLRAAVANGPPYAFVERIEEVAPSSRELGESFDVVY